jgi:hypothetical protein
MNTAHAYPDLADSLAYAEHNDDCETHVQLNHKKPPPDDSTEADLEPDKLVRRALVALLSSGINWLRHVGRSQHHDQDFFPSYSNHMFGSSAHMLTDVKL